MWHCPHCGAPQAETARCWVCRRSSTTCSTCRHFRASLATDLGYCGLDRQRRPLTGLELRACWTGRPAGAAVSAADADPMRSARSSRAGETTIRGFVPVEGLLGAPAAEDAPEDPAPPSPLLGWDSRTSLFGDLER